MNDWTPESTDYREDLQRIGDMTEAQWADVKAVTGQAEPLRRTRGPIICRLCGNEIAPEHGGLHADARGPSHLTCPEMKVKL